MSKENPKPSPAPKDDEEKKDKPAPTEGSPLKPRPKAPASVDETAVVTTESGLKYGWQQAPVRSIPDPQTCVHIGTVAAKAQLVVHDYGHEWVCDCGQVFVVWINSGGKKTLIEKEKVDRNG